MTVLNGGGDGGDGEVKNFETDVIFFSLDCSVDSKTNLKIYNLHKYKFYLLIY